MFVRILKASCLSITRHDDLLEVCVGQMVNVCSQHACQCYTAFASARNACIISSYSTFQRDWESFSHCHHYFLLFSDKKDNHGFLKYVFVQLSINLATPLALDIFFITHNAFLCHIFREWGKVSWYYHIL